METSTYVPITDIKPTKKYSLNEIWRENLIPNLHNYTSIYDLVMTKRVQIKGKKFYNKRKLVGVTEKKSLKAFHVGKTWSKIKGKIYVEGKELILFRKLNNLL